MWILAAVPGSKYLRNTEPGGWKYNFGVSFSRRKNSIELPLRQVFESKQQKMQCRIKREQLSYQTLIEITAEGSKPGWILRASWCGSCCSHTCGCFPCSLCQSNAGTVRNAKLPPTSKPGNLSEGDEKCTKVINWAFCCKYPRLQTGAGPSFRGMCWEGVLLQDRDIKAELEEDCNI